MYDVFGKENIIIRPFEKSQMENGLIYDFFSNALNFSDEDISKLEPVANYNESLCRDILEFKSASKIDDRKIFECASSLINNKNINSAFFTYTERKRLLSSYEKSNALVAKEYLGRKDGKLFYDEIKSYEQYSGLSLEKAKEIGRNLIALINYNNFMSPIDDIESLTTIEDVINVSKMRYFDNITRDYIDCYMVKLFALLSNFKKNAVIYGVFGQLASQIFEVANTYKTSVDIYVSDKLLENKIIYEYYPVVGLNSIEAFSPDVIIIAAKSSGKVIKRHLEKLNLPNTLICPVYDFSDEIWEKIIPSFFTVAMT